MKRYNLQLVNCLLIILVANYVQATMVYPLQPEEQRLFKKWKDSTEFFTRPDMEEKKKQRINWLGDIQEKEKEEIFSFITSQSEFGLPGKVLKADLDGDGIPDYVLWECILRIRSRITTAGVMGCSSGKRGDLSLE